MAGRYFVYILASDRNGTLYVGVTSNLARRVEEHRQDVVPGFACKHAAKRLVHFEAFDRAGDAIRREKSIKRWHRRWKLELIEKRNPYWRDVADEIPWCP